MCPFSILSTIYFGFLSVCPTKALLTREMILDYLTVARNFRLGYVKPLTAKIRGTSVSQLNYVPISALEQLFNVSGKSSHYNCLVLPPSGVASLGP
jgi:hypothetical protein